MVVMPTKKATRMTAKTEIMPNLNLSIKSEKVYRAAAQNKFSSKQCSNKESAALLVAVAYGDGLQRGTRVGGNRKAKVNPGNG